VAAFEPLAETESVRLTVSVNGPTPPVLADRDRLQQVLANLLSNALRHAGASGDSQVAVRVTGQRGAQVQISVADNGPGLTPEAQAHVFDRFWRADEARNRDQGGSGLGLAICRGIVEAHGGRIWVESQPNAGTAFIFELPAAA
jgi:signal transduction histidine kinase